MSNVTLVVKDPHMKGDLVKSWQQEVKAEFKKLKIDCPIVIDGDYGVASRNFTASLCHALGMVAGEVMKNGVTPELRTKIRNRQLTPSEQQRYGSRVDWRRNLQKSYEKQKAGNVHRLTRVILGSSWDYHGKAHDGIDVTVPKGADLFAMVKCKVIDVRSGGWWGKSPSGDVSLGDGIVQVEILETVGPFKRGRHIGYGHCEHAVVKVGQVLEPGDKVAKAGLAVTHHCHLMMNDGSTTKGVGNLDPRECLTYATKNG